MHHAIRRRHRLRLKVDREHMVRPAGLRRKLRTYVHRQADGQDAVLVAVIMEDIGKARRDDAGDALVQQRPRCMLT